MPILGGGQIYSKINIDKELTKVNPVEILTSGKITKDDIGKTVYLSNSVAACQEWRIADVDHDSTSGTVDLFPKYLLENATRVFGNSGYYKNSSLRTWLTTTFYNGFTAEVKNAMKVQSFPSNGVTLNDKVKCPSVDEIGCNKGHESWTLVEGTIYPIFGTQQSRPNDLAVYKYTNGDQIIRYWTRSLSINISAGNYVWAATATCGNYLCGSYYAVIACIRF